MPRQPPSAAVERGRLGALGAPWGEPAKAVPFFSRPLRARTPKVHQIAPVIVIPHQPLEGRFPPRDELVDRVHRAGHKKYAGEAGR